MLDIDPATVVRKGRLQPGRMFLVDTDEHRIIEDEEIKGELAAEHPYDEWLHAGIVRFEDLPDREHIVHTHASVTRRQQVFGYTEEELRVLLTPMARTGAEPIGSMGTDTPIAALSRPAAAAVRLLRAAVRAGHQPAAGRDPRGARHLAVRAPSAPRPTCSSRRRRPAASWCCRSRSSTNDELAKIRHINRDGDLPGYATHVVPRPVRRRGRRPGAGRPARRDLRRGVGGDRRRRPDHRALRPALHRRARADPVAAAHRRRAPPPGPREDPHPGRPGRRGRRRPRGAPRRAADRLRRGRGQPLPRAWSPSRTWPATATTSTSSPSRPCKNLVKALGKGVLKVMSKMGVSTVASYTGAQIFEARRPVAAARRPLLHRHHLQARRRRARHRSPRRSPAGTARPTRSTASAARAPRARRSAASTSGAARASRTCSTPRRCSGCSTPPGPAATTSSSSTPTRVDEQSERLMTLRGLFTFKRRRRASRSRSTRSSRSPRSSSGSPPARCPTARSARRRTRRWRSR